MTNQPKLTDRARDEFRAALLQSADAIFDRPDAAATLKGFIDGDLFLVLTRDRLFVREVPSEQSAEQAPPPAEDPPSEATRQTGFYL